MPASNGCADEIQKLCDVLLAERHILVIYNKAGYAHDEVLIFQIFKVVNIIYMSSDVRILSGDSLGGNHQIRAHGTRKGDQNPMIPYTNLIEKP